MARTARDDDQRIGRSWLWWVIGGAVGILGGTYALFNPLAATFKVTVLAGVLFLVLGTAEVISATRMWGSGSSIWKLLLGILTGLTGYLILANPLAGIVAFAFVVAASFLAIGVVKLIMGLRLQPRRGWGWMVLSGLISGGLAVLLFRSVPQSAPAMLGILLAVELLSTGFALVFSGLELRRPSRR